MCCVVLVLLGVSEKEMMRRRRVPHVSNMCFFSLAWRVHEERDHEEEREIHVWDVVCVMLLCSPLLSEWREAQESGCWVDLE